MSDAPSREKELFEGLKALSDSAFPKECATCGRVYRSPQDFVQQSDDIAGRSGLKLGYDDDDRPVVELFRNCVCGSTLMDFFSDRRETSRAGLKRRQPRLTETYAGGRKRKDRESGHSAESAQL